MNDADRSALVARLEKLETAVMSDVLDEMGYPNQVLASNIRPLDPTRRLAGYAYCVRGEYRVTTQSQPPEGAKPLSPYELERAMKPGMVGVIDAGGNTIGAMIGGFIAISLKNSGCCGFVTNGAVRDSREIVELGLPTYCSFVSPINSGRRWVIAEVEQPIHLPGIAGSPVSIRPGDLLLGDGDGLIVIPIEIAGPALEAAEKLDQIEKTITQGIRAGGNREQLFAKHPRFAHIKRFKP